MSNYFKKIAFVMLFLCAGIYGTVNAFEKQSEEITLEQEEQYLVATFEGHSDEGFKFLMKDDTAMIFNKVSDEVLELFDLKSDAYKGKTFEVAYVSKEKEGETVLIITGLKELKPKNKNS